jgi:hypothetical protein
MASSSTFPARPPFPDELVAAVVFEAQRDADKVCVFLRHLGVTCTVETLMRLPVVFLRDLGAALRLLVWEHAGLRVHLEVGLPPAREALENVLRSVVSPRRLPADFALRVVGLVIDRFAWDAPHAFGADVALDFLPDDDALDALAEFFWAHRHDGDVHRIDSGETP